MMWSHFLLNSSYVSIFSQKLNFHLFLLDFKLYFYFFFVFRLFASFNVLSLRVFFLTFIMDMCYFILVWRRLKSIKFKKMFFSYPSPTNWSKSKIQNDPLMQLFNFKDVCLHVCLSVCTSIRHFEFFLRSDSLVFSDFMLDGRQLKYLKTNRALFPGKFIFVQIWEKMDPK